MMSICSHPQTPLARVSRGPLHLDGEDPALLTLAHQPPCFHVAVYSCFSSVKQCSGWFCNVILQVNLPPDSELMVGNEGYQLLQFHFHTPSEHTVSGQHTAMEAHLVHRNKTTGR